MEQSKIINRCDVSLKNATLIQPSLTKPEPTDEPYQLNVCLINFAQILDNKYKQ